ncbi:phage major capsid protein [Arthrobacter sp. IA7]|uniref:phage major capsid protein n=1 Tax=Arthrobacter ipis TaxID=2716202 RepID=UPI00168862EB|nr:phage major capsid protein [Arthrobacter ipis]MBD1541027.1 phage major capsid protein [Arthrobacter ipis]
MAITAPTTTSDFAGFIKPDQAAGIFDQAARQSVVQGLAQRVALGASGQDIPIVTGKPTANWTGEGQRKHSSKGSMTLLPMKPEKLTSIVVVSAETVRANPGGYVTNIRGQLAEAFAIAFDLAALHNTGGDGTGTGPFDRYIDQTTKSVELGTGSQASGGIYADLNSALRLLVNDGKKLRGWALDDTAEPTLNSAVDLNGRPLFVESPYDGSALDSGRLLRRPALYAEGIGTDVVVGTPNTGGIVGYGGDWTQAAWGAVGGISYRVSTEATVTINGELVSLFENNLVAILAEAEYGFVVNDTEAFVKLTNHTA